MAGGKYAAVAVACMDGRFREAADYYLDERFGRAAVDVLFAPGASLTLTMGRDAAANLLDGLDLAYRLHGVRRLVFLEHEDCGKYAACGIRARTLAADRRNHERVADRASARLRRQFPGLTVDGTFLTLAFAADVDRRRARRLERNPCGR